MRERPILFSTSMVQAILAGRKTMTRRLTGLDGFNEEPDRWEYVRCFDGHAKFSEKGNHIMEWYVKCHYGKPGDVLWVRETWAPWGDSSCAYLADGFVQRYGAWERDTTKLHQVERIERRKPSIHMPKAAARILLQITDIRVERLQDITHKDAIAEGASDTLSFSEINLLKDLDWIIPSPFMSHQFGFVSLWCKINGTDNWEANPWVWVVSFKVLSKIGKPKFKSLESTEKV